MLKTAPHICICKNCGFELIGNDVAVQTESTFDASASIDFFETLNKPGAPFRNNDPEESKYLMVKLKRCTGDTSQESEAESFTEEFSLNQKQTFKNTGFDFEFEDTGSIRAERISFNSKDDTFKERLSEDSSLNLIKELEKVVENAKNHRKFPSSASTERYVYSPKESLGSTPKDNRRPLLLAEVKPFYLEKKSKYSIKAPSDVSKREPVKPPSYLKNKENLNPFAISKTEQQSEEIENLSQIENESSEISIEVEETSQLSGSYTHLFDKHKLLDPNSKDSFRNLVQMEKNSLRQQFSGKKFKFGKDKKFMTEMSED